MKKLTTLFFIAFSAIACAEDNSSTQTKTIAQVEKPHHQGESLHNDKCTSCHGNEVYTREDRMVKTMSALENQVSNCMTGAAKANWTNAQTTSVIEFLNERYYKF